MTKVLSVSTAQLQATTGANLKLESNEVLLATDLVCEGPIEGLVDIFLTLQKLFLILLFI